MKQVTAIFDIGKTNKKFFLFNENLEEVFKQYQYFDEITDEDGFPCEDLPKVVTWAKSILKKVLDSGDFSIKKLNFSCYGASLVHLDKQGQLIPPFYNYLKPIQSNYLHRFYEKYGTPEDISLQTSSPKLEMLNSGLQLYWLKHHRPEVFQKIKWSLHLPQYFSFLFTGKLTCDYASVGCHTALWDFSKAAYHTWVNEEGLDIKFPAISPFHYAHAKVFGHQLEVGTGIHDSSAALIPYLAVSEESFVLISTGTWSICLNAFSKDSLSKEDLKSDCLHFLDIKGNPIKASRLFLGAEYQTQTNILKDFFSKKNIHLDNIQFDLNLYHKLSHQKNLFKFQAIKLDRDAPIETNLSLFKNLIHAYHQLMLELVYLQIQSLNRVMGNTSIQKIFIDGGFVHNDVFINMLKINLPDKHIYPIPQPLGSSLGAALLMEENPNQALIKEKLNV